MPGKSVLIVEDEGIVLLNLKSILEYRGYSVADAVASGEDAVRSVERKRPDIVLMDIVLDGPIDGIEATKRILALCDVPVVYMTAYSGQDVLQRAKTTNPYGFLVKPIGENELVSSIEIALYKHEMERRLRESTGKYRLIVENLNDVVFSTDENGVITFISRGVDEASGYEPAEIVGNAFGNFVHPADREKAAQVLLRLSSGEAVRSEYRLVHKNGSDLWIRTSSKPFFVNGRFAGVRGVLTDITRSKAVEAELEKKNEELEALNEELIATNEELEASNEAFETQNRELIEAQISVTSSQQRLEYALDAASDGLWDWDVKSGKVYYSARFYTMAGYDPDDFPALFESWRERVHPEDLPEALQRLVEHAAGKSAQYSMEFRFRKKDGCWIWILSRGKVVERDRAGAALRVVGTHLDITQMKMVEAQLRDSEARFRYLQEASFGGIGIHDRGRIIDCNRGLCDMTGYSYEELVGMNGLLLIAPESRDLVMQNIVNDYDRPYDAVGLRRDGSAFPIEIRGKVIPYNDTTARVTEFRDITERKRFEEEMRLNEETLKSSLAEKDILLKEIHHRVKNNMQVISSLLSLQSAFIRDEADRRLFIDSQSRVRSMALVHEKLYQSSNLASIQFNDFLSRLVQDIRTTYCDECAGISIEVGQHDVSLGVDRAVPAALIVNELVSNAIKYAFPGGRGGRIALKVEETGGGDYMIEVSDDGVGLPEGINFRSSETLGLQLVNALTQQLMGDIELVSGGGTCFRIIFPGRGG